MTRDELPVASTSVVVGQEFAAGTATAVPRVRSASSRWIVRLVFLIYWLLIFEGALRKWVFPESQQLFYFVRDPFVLLVYLLAFARGVFPRRSLFLLGGMMLGVSSLSLLPFQLSSEDLSPAVFAYGWRNYFFYLPLAFIIRELFSKEDLHRLLRQTLLVGIPIAALVLLQFSSPTDAPINASFIEGGIYQPGVSGGYVRTVGTFTSSAGQTPFIASLVAMVLAAWLMPVGRRPVKGVLLWAASAAALTSLAVSGSRGAFAMSALIVLAAAVGGFATGRAPALVRTLVIVAVLVIAAGLLVPLFFSEALNALAARMAGAYAEEIQTYPLGTVGRAFSTFGSFLPFLLSTPLPGYGLGLFGNAYSAIGAALLPGVQVEDDWIRNILELGPLLGALYICYRVAFVAWLGKRALAATRRSRNLLPVLLFAFAGLVLLNFQITGQGSINGFGWLFAGFSMAANRTFHRDYAQS